MKTRPRLLQLDPWELEVSSNVRGQLSDEDVRRMAEDLLSAGCQLQPVGVRKTRSGWRLIYGHRRLEALRWLSQHADLPPDSPLRTVSAIEVPSDEEELLVQIRENSARRNLKPLEEAEIVSDLLREGYSVERIASVFGRSPGWVSQRRALLELPPEIRQLVGVRISTYDGYQLSRMSPEDRQRRVQQLLGQTVENRDSGQKVVRRIRPTARDASRLLSRVRRSCPESREVLDRLIDYLEGRLRPESAEKILESTFRRKA